MVLAIPGGIDIFSTLQDVLFKSTLEGFIRLTQPMHTLLEDFRLLASQLDSRTARISEILPGEPDYLGLAYASGVGMGGICLPDPRQSPAIFQTPLL